MRLRGAAEAWNNTMGHIRAPDSQCTPSANTVMRTSQHRYRQPSSPLAVASHAPGLVQGRHRSSSGICAESPQHRLRRVRTQVQHRSACWGGLTLKNLQTSKMKIYFKVCPRNSVWILVDTEKIKKLFLKCPNDDLWRTFFYFFFGQRIKWNFSWVA